MARINRYDSPAESNYFNTFVPLPLDQITALGMKRQEDLERKQDAASKYIDQASLVDYIANSKDEEWVKQSYLPLLQKHAEEAMSVDLSNPVEWAKYSTRLRSLGTSDRIRRIEESKARWNQAQEMKQRLIAAGKYNQLLDEDPAIGWDSETGIYNYMPEAYTDKAELFEQYYKHMKPQSKGIVTLPGGIKVLRHAIDMNDIRNISNRAAQELAANPLGQQQVRLFRKMYPGIEKDLSDVDILKMQMEDYGKEYIRSDDQVLPEFAQGIGDGKVPLVSSWSPTATPGTSGKYRIDPSGVLGGLYSGGDSGEGGEPVSGKDLWKGAMSAAGKAAMSGGQYPDMTDYSKAGLTEEGENKRVSKILSDFPELQFDNKGKKLTNRQIMERYRQLSKNPMGGAIYTSNDPETNALLDDLLDNKFTTFKYLIPGTNEVLNVREAAKKLIGTADVDEFRKSMRPAGPSFDLPYGMAIQISPSKKNKYARGTEEAGNQIVAVGDIAIENELANIRNIKHMVETGGRGPVMLATDEAGTMYGVDIGWRVGERNGKESFVPTYKMVTSKPDGTYDYVYQTDKQGNVMLDKQGDPIPMMTNMDDIFKVIVDNMFKGQGLSPYDVNLGQSVSSTARRVVRSGR